VFLLFRKHRAYVRVAAHLQPTFKFHPFGTSTLVCCRLPVCKNNRLLRTLVISLLYRNCAVDAQRNVNHSLLTLRHLLCWIKTVVLSVGCWVRSRLLQRNLMNDRFGGDGVLLI
jgi:hypothetical protein